MARGRQSWHARNGARSDHALTRVLLTFLLAFCALPALAGSAAAGTSEVTEYVLGANDYRPGPITLGPDGNMWFANSYGTPGDERYSIDWHGQINRIAPDGEITEFDVPHTFIRGITTGSDGNIWFVVPFAIGKMTTSGGLEEFDPPRGWPEDLVSGPGGDLWMVANSGSGVADYVARISVDGEITEFSLPDSRSAPSAITVGSGGDDLWFTEYRGNRIARITTDGQLTEFPLPHENSRPASITAGPDGNVWFTESFGNRIGRITPDGDITEFPFDSEPAPGGIISGPDGRLWFVRGQGLVGRMTTDGRVSYVKLPNPISSIVNLAVGPEGDVWYAAKGEGPCRGGGGSCMRQTPSAPGIIGRIKPGPLATSLPGRRAPANARWARMRVACTDGNADQVCRGALRLTIEVRRNRSQTSTIVLARRNLYSLPTDTARPLALRLTRPGRRILRRHPRLRVDATATAWRGEGSVRKMVLRGRGRR